MAQDVVVALAAVAHGDGDPTGLAMYDDRERVRVLPPRTRRGVVEEIARVVDAADPDGDAPLAPLIAPLRGGRIAVVTDLLGDADELLRAARAHVVSGGEVHLIHVVAREELEPPRRTFLAADPEQPGIQRLLMDTTRREYERAFADWRAEMARRWRGAGAAYTEVLSDEPVAHAVRRIAEPPGGGARLA